MFALIEIFQTNRSSICLILCLTVRLNMYPLSLSLFIYIYMCVFVCVRAHTHTHTYTHRNVAHTHTHTHTRTHTFLPLCWLYVSFLLQAIFTLFTLASYLAISPPHYINNVHRGRLLPVTVLSLTLSLFSAVLLEPTVDAPQRRRQLKMSNVDVTVRLFDCFHGRFFLHLVRLLSDSLAGI